jgi:hypothetical protein
MGFASLKKNLLIKTLAFKVTRIKNNASFLRASAEATAAYMVSEARINYEKTIEQVHNEGKNISL